MTVRAAVKAKLPTYKKEGYRCGIGNCREVFFTPQLKGVHVRRVHSGGKNAAAKARTGKTVVARRPAALPHDHNHGSMDHLSRPNLLQVRNGHADECEYYLVDADDSTRMMHIDKVIQVTLE